ncbi:hypothetical protein ABEB36_014666 [Hypothenemus hampei]|uniref:Uncharacterized protein n=1 Tax=Hypothenemus hampei TaxID=57062 RepID=A0ABD1E2G7_HYPHA
METRCITRSFAQQLTEEEVRNAMNSDNELNTLHNDFIEEEQSIDEATDSEIDHESNFEDTEEEENEENGDDVDMGHAQMYHGQDGTQWNSNPEKPPRRPYVRHTALHSVNLRPVQQLKTISKKDAKCQKMKN